jgi:hypothetical protein
MSLKYGKPHYFGGKNGGKPKIAYSRTIKNT